MAFLYRRRDGFDPIVLRLIVASIVLTIGAELAFTFYISVYGLSNQIGHLFKIVSFYLIYKAVVVTGIRDPYALIFRELKESESALRRSEKRYRSLYLHTPGLLCTLGPDGRLVEVNERWLESMGFGPEEVVGRRLSSFMAPECRRRAETEVLPRFFAGGNVHDVPFRFVKKDGEVLDVLFTAVEQPGKEGGTELYLAALTDVTEQMRAERQREELIGELQEALTRIKKLSGLLPICSSCKQIRDDQGYWHQVEQYIRQHSEAEFSHSICPPCARRLYPEYFDDDSELPGGRA
jgi:PAS domain S-box-containing protein